ncbi:hypothetical protein J7L68_04715, partial [bacterium]|nr:hypothetical protein [bacterium]
FVLISPAFGQSSSTVQNSANSSQQDSITVQSSTHSFSMKLGPLKVFSMSVDTLDPAQMKIIAMGSTISLDIDTSQIPIDTLIAIIDSANVQNKQSMLKLGFAANSNDEDEYENESKSSAFASIFDSIESVITVAIVFFALLLLFLGIPILLFILLYVRWRWVHNERMKALETGIVIPQSANVKQPTVYLRQGLVLSLLGIGFLISITYIGGFGAVLGIIFAMWGLGYLLWYFITGRKNENIKSNEHDENRD